MDVLNARELIRSSQYYAHRAWDAYLAQDTRSLLPDAAISLEHLAKAYLCRHHPALAVESGGKDFDSLLHVFGLGGFSKVAHPRTVNATVALARVRQLLPNRLTATQPELSELLDIRNGAMHAGFLPQGSTRKNFVVYLRTVDEIFEAMGQDSGPFWRERSAMVNSLTGDFYTEMGHEVRRRLVLARVQFEDLAKRLPAGTVESVVTARQATAILGPPGQWDIAARRCPACEQDAPYAGTVQVTHQDLHLPSNGEPAPPDLTDEIWTFFPEHLSCGVCGLELRGLAELKVINVPESWKLDPVPESYRTVVIRL